MKPYYDQDGITIYHGDCLDVLPGVADVGLIVTSPPYNLSGDGPADSLLFRHDGHNPNGAYFRNLKKGYGNHTDAMPHEAYRNWQRSVLTLCWTALTGDGAIFYNHKPRVGGPSVRLPFDLIPDHVPLRQIITWDRGSGFNRQFTYFVPTYEWLLLLAKPAFRINTRSANDLWRIPFETGSEHPAPFPLSLAKQAIGSTNAALVMDPFMGSGTTLRAAKDLGRKAIGIELEERYCELAVQRLGQGVLALDGGDV